MKIKHDFITNSSSTTFIVIFTNKIETPDELFEYIKNQDKANQVFSDIKAQTPKLIKADDEQLLNIIKTEMNSNSIYDIDEDETLSYTKFQNLFCKREGITSRELYKNPQWLKAFYDEYENIKERLITKRAIDFMSKNEGKYLYIFHYSDSDGEFFSEMEHGGTFDFVNHIAIDNH